MQFGQRVRELRKQRKLTQRQLASRLGVTYTYISKVECEKLYSGDYPSERFIHKLAAELDSDEEELIVLAERVPERIRQRFLERPDVFGALAECDDTTLDRVIASLKSPSRKLPRKTK